MSFLNFDQHIKEFKTMLKAVVNRLDEVSEKIDVIEEKIAQSDQKFGACAGGFYQVRDACTVLIEKLDEASGTITEKTWITD